MADTFVKVLNLATILTLLPLSQVSPCGVSTHIAIAHEALNSFSDEVTKKYYRQLLQKHQDAFLGGNPYPDIMYPSVCFEGKYHQVSEDTHWTPFLNATINYIRRKYPKPWDEATEKLVVFTLGFVSHQVADISWHSLGIDQGFLTTMGNQNFFGSFPAAHSVGDIGGDIVADFEGDEKDIKTIREWYIPVQDLVNIYSEYYGQEKVNSLVITTCSQILFLAWAAEKLAGRELFSHYAKTSPFLVENFHNYFLGGVHDMAAWTSEIWADTVYMLDNGMENCNMPRPPLFITCKKTQHLALQPHEQKKLRNPGLWYPLDLYNLELSDTVVKETYRGVKIMASTSLSRRLLKNRKEKELMKRKEQMTLRRRETLLKKEKTGLDISRVFYTTTTPYAQLGWSSTTGNFSGIHQDLVIGAPNHGYPGNSQFGRVYLVHVNPITGLPLVNLTLDTDADQVIDGTVQNGRFGTTLVVVDLNKDGLDDLVVSAPSVGANKFQYTGVLYVFFGNHGSGLGSKPNLTIHGTQTYDNIGITMAGADLDQDGFSDLVVGCPYAQGLGGGEQRGMVGIFLSSPIYKHGDSLSILAADWLLYGQQNYSWFGFRVSVTTVKDDMAWLLISAPTFRLCGLKSCRYSDNDTQSVGQLSMYRFHPSKGPLLSSNLTGQDVFAKLGSSAELGDPFSTGVRNILAVSSNSADVKGTVVSLPEIFSQAGVVNLFNISDNLKHSWQYQNEHDKNFAVFESDRCYSRLGTQVSWLDLNMDGIDDLVVSAPFRTNQLGAITGGVEQGTVYVFYGGKSFPIKDATRNCSSSLEVVPCPADKASLVFSPEQDESQFGFRFIALSDHTNSRLNFIVSSPQNSKRSFRGGAVYVYNVKK